MRVEAHDGAIRSGWRGRVPAAVAGAAMLLAAVIALPGTASATPSGADVSTTPQTLGMNVSAAQGTIDWDAAWKAGARFAYIKATESTSYFSPYFAAQSAGASRVGMLHGAYHFATPDTSSGPAQADYFLAHGGGWSADGQTLPPLLDIEYNPNGAGCYGMSQAGMVTWIRNFVDEVHLKTTRWPVIYTSTAWWTTCTGNSPSFGADDPLFIAGQSDTVGALPAGWSTYTFRQGAETSAFPGGENWYNGTLDQLKAFATG